MCRNGSRHKLLSAGVNEGVHKSREQYECDTSLTWTRHVTHRYLLMCYIYTYSYIYVYTHMYI